MAFTRCHSAGFTGAIGWPSHQKTNGVLRALVDSADVVATRFRAGSPAGDVTRLLAQVSSGQAGARAASFDVLSAELRRLAGAVKREWQISRAWLSRELKRPSGAADAGVRS